MSEAVADTETRRRGIEFFPPPTEAPNLWDTDMMSLPAFDDEVGDQVTEWALSPGHVVRVLYRDGDMSLVWSWFGPDYMLPRHSHDSDCLYVVIAGEAHAGSRVLTAGAGFFVPADAPYAYTAGSEGVQVLEFRGVTSFDMKISEKPGRWDKIVETVREKTDDWRAGAEAFG